MSFRFRRSVKIAPGVRLNFGKNGLSSFSAGPRGASVSFGDRGVYGNVGLPGTGLSYRSKLGGGHSPSQRQATTKQPQGFTELEVALSLESDGELRFTTKDGILLPETLVREAKRQQKRLILSWLEEQAIAHNGLLDGLANIHLHTPPPDTRISYVCRHFPEPPPVVINYESFDKEKPSPPTAKWWGKLLPSKLREQQETYERELDKWAQAKQRFEDEQEKSQKLYVRRLAEYRAREKAFNEKEMEWKRVVEETRLTDRDAMASFLEESLQSITWPRETIISFELDDSGQQVWIDVDLPEVEDLPETQAKVNKRSMRLDYKKLSQLDTRRRYAQHIHAVVFRIVGEVFISLPTALNVVISGYSQRAQPATGHTQDDYLLSAIVERSKWEAINFSNLEAVDVVQCFDQFTLRRDLSRSMILTAIEPFGSDIHAPISPPVQPAQTGHSVPSPSKGREKRFMDIDDLKAVGELRRQGELDEAERILVTAIPTPAVLDEYRKALSARAKLARKDNDWATVAKCLETYQAYADEHREECINLANQAPPDLKPTELKLLEKARQEMQKG